MQDPAVPHALTRKMMQAIIGCQYGLPTNLKLTPEYKDLLAQIFVKTPAYWHCPLPGAPLAVWRPAEADDRAPELPER
ncbi:hypothetical protein WJX72_012037 [[Myrmecia] bisecta]|uniref:Uncharacterized protein n=1 Tax=[Myrmecia] bisecta TaxID=41462 RepID=A0AAW1R9P9_9CHLO